MNPTTNCITPNLSRYNFSQQFLIYLKLNCSPAQMLMLIFKLRHKCV